MAQRPARKATVLAIDDNQGNLIALEAVLSSDFELVFASSGSEGLAVLISRRDIDVILLDVHMPEMDGFQTAVEIKKIEGCRDIPIVFITAVYKDDPFVRKGYEAGAIDYFGKPFDPDILKLKVGVYAAFRQRSGILEERERQFRETQELAKAGRKLSSVLEALPVGILIADAQGRICQTNEALFKICRVGDSYGDILGWWDKNGHALKDKGSPLSRALEDGETLHNEVLSVRCIDGSPKTIFASASPLFGLDRRIVGAAVILQDMTEPKRIGEELEDRIANLINMGVAIEQSALQ
jgi:response regulator RpfG family c-di-GMP phosphodiesterase